MQARKPKRGAPVKPSGIALLEEDGSSLSELAAATPAERLRLLDGLAGGLSAVEVARRLRRFGKNEPAQDPGVPPLGILAAQFTHTLALLLWFAAGLAFASGITELGAAIVAVVVINGFFAFIQEYRAGKVVDSLMRRVAIRVRVPRDGKVETVEAAFLVPGDIVELDAGDVVPADCLLLESNNLTVDLSMLTGESFAVSRDAAPVDLAGAAPHLSEVSCVLPAGSGVVTGNARAVVWGTGPNSSVGQIAGLVQGAAEGPSILERQVESLSRTTAIIAVTAGAATLILASAVQRTAFSDALTFGTGIIVALVPEGLLPTLSVALAIGAQRIAQRGAAVRQLAAVEVIGSVTVICTDKTGTLTENMLTVEGFTAPDGSGKPTDRALLAAVLCSEAEVAEGHVTGDPLDVALWRWAAANGFDPQLERERHPVTALTPFDAYLRLMSVTCRFKEGNRTFVKGAPEAVLPRTAANALPASLTKSIDDAAARGDRMLLLASGPEGGSLELLGVVAFQDPPRHDVPAAIAACRRAGIRVIMLTGDHPETARSIAAAVGLGDPGIAVLAGHDIDTMTDPAIRSALSDNTVVARVNPEQKLRIVKALKQAGEIVVVTGDGINDAPALQAADVGVAMGLNGTEVAKQAADIVLADDNFVTIVAGIEEGRSIRANIRRFVSYVFTSNVAEMVPFLVYIFFPVPLPLAVIQALAIDIGTDLLPALTLGIEPPSQDTLTSPPRGPHDPLLSRALAIRTFLFFGVIEALLGMTGFFLFYVHAGWRPGDSFGDFSDIAHKATTLTFLAIVGGQVGCFFAQRDGALRQRFDLRTNGAIKGALAFELVLAVALVYIPGVNSVFSMSPVPAFWLLAVPMGALVFTAADEARRLLAGRAAPKRPLSAVATAD